MKLSGKIVAGMVATFVVLKAFLEGSATLPPPNDEWLTPPYAMGGTVGLGEEHLPDHIHYLEASGVSAVVTSGSPTGTAIDHTSWILQVDGEPWASIQGY